MKKILLFLMLITIVSLTSYSQQNDLTLGDEDMVSITFTINDVIQTRSGSVTRYVLEVYKGTDVSGEKLWHEEEDTGSFTVSIRENTDYVFLFWADAGTVDNNSTGSYNASDLKNVTLNAGKDMTEAFFLQKAVNISSSPSSNNVTLKRAVAEVNFIEEATVAINTNLQVDFNRYTSFNVFTGGVVGTATAKTFNFTITTTTGTLGTLLTFASVTPGITATFTAIYNSTVTHTLTGSLKANHRTNFKGDFAN